MVCAPCWQRKGNLRDEAASWPGLPHPLSQHARRCYKHRPRFTLRASASTWACRTGVRTPLRDGDAEHDGENSCQNTPAGGALQAACARCVTPTAPKQRHARERQTQTLQERGPRLHSHSRQLCEGPEAAWHVARSVPPPHHAHTESPPPQHHTPTGAPSAHPRVEARVGKVSRDRLDYPGDGPGQHGL